MPFQCPECSTRTLKITHKLELPPDSRSDEITLQIVECSRCNFGAIAIYEESRRGALNDDSFDHTGYRIGADDLAALRKAIRACPRPTNHRCTCATHRKLGARSESGRWNGLSGVRRESAFGMRL